MTRRVSGRVAALLLSSLLAGGMGYIPARAQVAADKQLIFDLLDRIERLESDIRQLRGSLEVYRHRQENLERRLADLEAGKKGNGASRAGAPAEEELAPEPALSSSPPPEVEVPPADTPSPRSNRSTAPVAPASEQAAYDTAFNMLREGHFEQSVANFQEFLRNYPNSRLAGNAQYWLGEAYYVTRDFENAKQAFINLGVSYPNSDKVPDALLKLGYIYGELGDKAKAREILNKVMQAYPGSQAASLAQKRLSLLK